MYMVKDAVQRHGIRNTVGTYDNNIIITKLHRPRRHLDIAFEVADKSDIFHNVVAVGKGCVITLVNPAFTPTAVRYAWKDDPKEANVRSLSGLPMSSFELKLKVATD
jgi:hypothetical protein